MANKHKGSTQEPPAPRREPQQSRSRELVRAIREAGLALLKEAGPAALTTNRIAERAGVGIASLYRYYPDREAVLADIFEAKLEDIDRQYQSELASNAYLARSLNDKLRQIIEVPIAINRELLSLHREFFTRHQFHYEITYRPGPDGQESWEEWSEKWWLEILSQHRDELRVNNVEQAAFIVLSALRGAIDNATSRYPQYIYDDGFIEEMLDMVGRYLRGVGDNGGDCGGDSGGDRDVDNSDRETGRGTSAFKPPDGEKHG
ncbi:TetR/AcrR family transcriptional regulator [Parahaliea mediterranea]|uniref:TetR/AcrR family transcriptional regulator n=1 Tax=Parahaliea mediterranea TaxID=651086 RepID=UPI000E2FE743|nr:TetR/AcrR family transcriptional regulator [Parahaliea mediterranea]